MAATYDGLCSEQAPAPSTHETAIARPPTPDLSSSDPTDTITRTSNPYRKTFFDLAPETRVEVYRQLFKGQVIMIRGQDEVMGRNREKKKRFERDRAMGLNIMFVSRTCLAEAKATILSVATFDINFTSMLRNGSETYLRKQQNFGRPQLAFLRTIDIPKVPHAIEGLRYQLSAMPFLHDVVWTGARKRVWIFDVKPRATITSVPEWTRFVDELLAAYPWHSPAHKVIKDHVEESAMRVRQPGRYSFKVPVQLSDWVSNNWVSIRPLSISQANVFA
jgi:hypothetical protein